MPQTGFLDGSGQCSLPAFPIWHSSDVHPASRGEPASAAHCVNGNYNPIMLCLQTKPNTKTLRKLSWSSTAWARIQISDDPHCLPLWLRPITAHWASMPCLSNRSSTHLTRPLQGWKESTHDIPPCNQSDCCLMTHKGINPLKYKIFGKNVRGTQHFFLSGPSFQHMKTFLCTGEARADTSSSTTRGCACNLRMTGALFQSSKG